MKKYLFLLLILFSSLVSPLYGQEEELSSPPVQEAIEPEHIIPADYYREVYNNDGTYTKYEGDHIVASGFHKDKVFHGELKKFDYDGTQTRSMNYKDGVLHGEFKAYYSGYIMTKYFTDGIQTGYETTSESDGSVQQKVGPLFIGKKTEHIFVSHDMFSYKGDLYIGRFDTIFFKANVVPEIHRWNVTLTKNEIVDTLFHAICKLENYCSAEYTMISINKLLADPNYTVQDFNSEKIEPNKEVTIFEKSGTFHSRTFADYRLTYHTNGALKDSIITAKNNYYSHFQYDETDKIIFKAKKDQISSNGPDDEGVFRWTYDYLKNNAVLYSISSVNYTPEKVWSLNDSINKVINKGEFTDYYGTVYITGPTGNIDTSYSVYVAPVRYTKSLKPARYYYLNSERSGYAEAIEVSESGIAYIRMDMNNLAEVVKRQNMKIVFQKDSLYQLYEDLNSTSAARKLILSKTGRIYSADCRRNVLDYPNYNAIEQLLAESYKDSAISFRSVLLTELEFAAALKMKSISGISKTEFMKYLTEFEGVRMLERNAKNKFSTEESKKIQVESRQLFQFFYNKGFNPYFTENEFGALMDGYAFTKEEKQNVKKIIRGY